MYRVFRFLLLLVVVVVSYGCAHDGQPGSQEQFPNRANRFDVRFDWSTIPSADALEVRGVATNVRYAYVEDLQLQLSLLDRGNHVKARETFFFIPQQIAMDHSAPFRIDLKGAATPGEKLQFLYQYRVNDGNDQFNWTSRFIADAATGAVLKEE